MLCHEKINKEDYCARHLFYPLLADLKVIWNPRITKLRAFYTIKTYHVNLSHISKIFSCKEIILSGVTQSIIYQLDEG